MKTWKLLAVALTVLQSSVVAQAAVSVGGRTFADNAFADAISLPAVTYLLWNGVTSNVQTSTNPALAAAAALDTPITQPMLSTSTFAGCADGQSEAVCGTVVIFFHDNRIVNGAGIDFTIFDVNNPATVKVTIGGTSIVRSTVLAGTTPRPSALLSTTHT